MHLESEPFNLGPSRSGLVAFVGLAGFFAAPSAGTLADRLGARKVVSGGISIGIVGLVTMLLSGNSLLALLAGVSVFDAGCFAAQAANQSRLPGIDKQLSERINSSYLLPYYCAGALGTMVGPAIFASAGWVTTCAVGTLGMTVAIAVLMINSMRGSNDCGLTALNR